MIQLPDGVFLLTRTACILFSFDHLSNEQPLLVYDVFLFYGIICILVFEFAIYVLCYYTHLSLASYKRDICKKCRPRSAQADLSLRWEYMSESTL